MNRSNNRRQQRGGSARSSYGRRADPPAESKAASWGWASGAQLVMAAAIVLLVFLPWLGRYIDGQFFGVTGDYGTDFFRYAMGSRARIELGLDPYSNEQMYQALESGRLATDHPNLNYDEQTSTRAFAESREPVAKGVVSPPLVLVILYPLLRVGGFSLALNSWTVAIFVGISWLSIMFWNQLTPHRSMGKRLASHSAMLSLLVLSSFPVVWSAVYGQFEVLYLLAMGGAIYLWSFRQDRASTPWQVGCLLALGGAIKVFPLLMLGYFAWLTLQAAWRLRGERSSWRTMVALPEVKVIVACLTCLGVLGVLTGVALSFDVYGSFLHKITDLKAEGTGPSMKGNLLSYLNFVPIWLTGPFAPMRGGMWIVYVLIAAGVVVLVAKTIQRPSSPPEPGGDDPLRRLLEMTLIVAALPTILPHWWIYYNAVLILPLMACFSVARTLRDGRRRRWVLALTAASFVLTFSYLTTATFFGAFPNLYSVLINRPAVDAALAAAANDPALLTHLPYSSALKEPLVAEFEGRVVSLFNLLYGYPGTVFLLAANWLVLRWRPAAAACRHDAIPATRPDDAVPRVHIGPRLTVSLTLAAAMVLPWAGGYALVQEGTRRLAQTTPVELIVDRLEIDRPPGFVDRILDRCGHASRQAGTGRPTGLIDVSPPPSHFITELASTDPEIAAAMMRQDQRYFEGPAVVEKVTALFARYQADLGDEYAQYTASGSDREMPPWRRRASHSGLLIQLEHKCREQAIPLRRLDQPWMLWQTEFLYERAWQRAVDSLRSGDLIAFARSIVEHRDALVRHLALREARDAKLRATIPDGESEAPGSPSFVFVGQPVYVALSGFPACRELDAEASVEQAVVAGTRYVVEELLRRARLAVCDDPRASLEYAQRAVSQVGERQIVDWWSTEAATGPAEILERLSRDGLVDLAEVDFANVLHWDPAPAR